MVDYSQDLKIAIDAAHKAGEIAMGFYRKEYQTQYKTLQGNSPVTEADQAVDTYLREILTAARPQYGWLSEETEDNKERLLQDTVWIVDPIDGTKSFIRQDDMFAISIALVKNGTPVLGVIHNPAKKETVSAVAGGGVRYNGALVKPRTIPDFDAATCLASVSEMRRGLWQALSQEVTVVPISSIAYKLALIAIGRMDMMASLRPKNEWDIAAGVVICQEAGMLVSNLDGHKFNFNREKVRVNGIIAAPEKLFVPLREAIDRHGKRKLFA